MGTLYSNPAHTSTLSSIFDNIPIGQKPLIWPTVQWGGQPHDIPRDGWAQEARGAQLQEPHGGPHDVQLHGHEFHTGHCIVMYRNFVIRSFQSPR